MFDDGGDQGGDLSGLLGAVLILYADRALGPTGVHAVMDHVGADKVISIVENWDEWVPLEVVMTIAIAVAELCHEPDIGRRAGEELFRVLQERGLLVVPPTLDLADIFPDLIASLSTATELREPRVVHCEEGFVRVEVACLPAGRTRFLCRTLLGLYASIPTLIGAVGAVVETRCIHRGDPVCEYEVRWRAGNDIAIDADPWTDRVQRFQQWAAGLATEQSDHASEALEAAQLLDEIRRQALGDPLTGLANRAALEMRVAEELERRGELDGLTLLFVDLDDFKQINDTHGHAVGDELLVQLAARLEGAVRATDVVSRLGGDEFVVLFPHVPDDRVVDRLVKMVHAVFENPYPIGDELHRLRGSVGVARAPEHGADLAALLAHADEGMYRAKRSRKDAPRR